MNIDECMGRCHLDHLRPNTAMHIASESSVINEMIMAIKQYFIPQIKHL